MQLLGVRRRQHGERADVGDDQVAGFLGPRDQRDGANGGGDSHGFNGGLKATTGAQIASLQQQLQATPQIQYVAVLADDKAAASMLVTFDPKNNQLVLQRVGGFQEGADKSLQLWALPPAGGPRSLGVLGQDKLLTLVAGEADVRQVPALAISLEPKGGVPSETGPTGPVLFKGELIQRML